jgi:hypothetical protein
MWLQHHDCTIPPTTTKQKLYLLYSIGRAVLFKLECKAADASSSKVRCKPMVLSAAFTASKTPFTPYPHNHHVCTTHPPPKLLQCCIRTSACCTYPCERCVELRMQAAAGWTPSNRSNAQHSANDIRCVKVACNTAESSWYHKKQCNIIPLKPKKTTAPYSTICSSTCQVTQVTQHGYSKRSSRPALANVK